MKQLDAIIVGGGMVGAATALGLAKLGLQIALIEKKGLPTFSAQSDYDLRISAISVASVNLLKKLGAWDFIQQMRIFAYDGLETWEIDGFKTTFSASELHLSELGYMVENNVIQLGLWQALSAYPNCQKVIGFEQLTAQNENGQWQLQADQQLFSSPLLLAADGANSQVRAWSGIGLTSWQYRQSCLLATVETQEPHSAVTWQQFFPTGPRAFLPLAGNNGCVVWYDSPAKIAQLEQCSNASLADEIMRHFPQRLGRITVKASGHFPLTRQHAQHYSKNGVVLLGDSAHTIHPLAGQGVNLGFKDVAAFLAIVEEARQKNQPLASDDVLSRYQRQRKPDNLMMQSAMDLFYKTFKSHSSPIKAVRNIGLFFAERATPLKKQALKYALGL